MHHISRKRIQKDYMDLVFSMRENENLCYEKDPICDLDNLTKMNKFTILLKGPKNTPYEEGKFRLMVTMPREYPDDPPSVKFLTRIYHPNIENNNRKCDWDICLDLLDTNWKPTYNLSKIFEYICHLLENPNPNDPLSPDVNSVYQRNHDEYLSTAKQWVKKYAM